MTNDRRNRNGDDSRGADAARLIRDGGPLPPTGPNQVWAYDFVFDSCANGQKLKCLTVVDEWTREALAIDRFRSRQEAVALIETWRRHYNEAHPHSSLGYRTPDMFKASCMKSISTRSEVATFTN